MIRASKADTVYRDRFGLYVLSGVALGCVVIFVLWLAALAEKMPADYGASIVRDTVAAMKATSP